MARSWVIVLGLSLALSMTPAAARMYQWTNPQTGRSQASGSPPPWYRSAQKGPRVLVYERGALVDDTSLPVGEARRDALRRTAFEEVERRKELLALQRLEETARRESAKAERESVARARKPQPVAVDPPEEGAAESPFGRLGSETIDRLKSIIAEFDRLSGEESVAAPPN